jgi:hypothetical protein
MMDERMDLDEPMSRVLVVGLWLSLDLNPQELVSFTIIRVRIHERGLSHVMKLVGTTDPNVQQSLPSTFQVSLELDTYHYDTICWNIH